MKNIKKIAVVGAGPSGMMCAIQLAKRGFEVDLFEYKEILGKKILATGNGKCNFTNIKQGYAHYNCSTPAFVRYTLDNYTPDDLIAFFKSIGVDYVTKENYVYPRSLQATTIQMALSNKIANLKITIIPGQVKKIIRDDNYILSGKLLDEDKKNYTDSFEYKYDAVVLACGGKSAPKQGSDGTGFYLASQLSIPLIEQHPALVGLKTTDRYIGKLAGVRVKGNVTLISNNEFLAYDTGEIQFNKDSISGICVFNISGKCAQELAKDKSCVIRCDFYPEIDELSLQSDFNNQIKNLSNDISVYDFLCGRIPDKLSGCVLSKCEVLFDKKCSELLTEDINAIVNTLKNFDVDVFDTLGFESSQVTTGGVDTAFVDDKSLESKVASNLYFCGEILDVDGECGGYNLHWAFASGFLVGNSIKND